MSLSPLSDEIIQAAERVRLHTVPSVVRIGRGPGRGAGVVVGDGAVLTNAHNLRGPQVTVTFADGHSAAATVAGVDAEGDLVALAVDTGGAPALPWAEEAPALGQVVFTAALPAGGGPRITAGTVSGLDRSFRGPRGRVLGPALEHTAPLGRGSSGGPVVDDQGRLVGINTHRLADGFYAALPADAALRERIEALGRGESPDRLRLGVALVPGRAARRLRAAVGLPERDGLLVRAVEEGGPAAAAGVAAGDLLVSAGGAALARIEDLVEALDRLGPGDTLTVGVVRGVDERELTLRFPTEAEEDAPGS